MQIKFHVWRIFEVNGIQLTQQFTLLPLLRNRIYRIKLNFFNLSKPENKIKNALQIKRFSKKQIKLYYITFRIQKLISNLLFQAHFHGCFFSEKYAIGKLNKSIALYQITKNSISDPRPNPTVQLHMNWSNTSTVGSWRIQTAT